ncbi:MAG: hypothetical protein IPK19_39640 [Chloroflexi bacterium]|nr:hypothetical protein [Chloroflexota bacterium]
MTPADPVFVETTAYLGIAAGLLALLGVLRMRAARIWLAAAALTFLLGLGPVLRLTDTPITFRIDGTASAVTLPLAWVIGPADGELGLIPGRFAFGMGLAVAVMAGYGAAVVLGMVNGRDAANGRAVARPYGWLVTGLLAAAAVVEMRGLYPTLVTSLGTPPQIAVLLGEAESSGKRGAVLHLPVGSLEVVHDALILQTAHGRPLINGTIAPTASERARMAILVETLDPALLGRSRCRLGHPPP